MVASQRRINLVWEVTQSAVALMVVGSNMIVGVYQAIWRDKVDVPFILSSSMFLIVGFYFSRTNHAAIGGIGLKPTQEYQGR